MPCYRVPHRGCGSPQYRWELHKLKCMQHLLHVGLGKAFKHAETMGPLDPARVAKRFEDRARVLQRQIEGIERWQEFEQRRANEMIAKAELRDQEREEAKTELMAQEREKAENTKVSGKRKRAG